MSASPATIQRGNSTTFTAAITGATSPFTYAWVFGDGGTSTVASPTHLYADAGTYNVQVTVTDALNSTATSTLSFVVTAAAPPPVLDAAVACNVAVHGATTTCNVTATFGGGAVSSAQITNVDWEWGDGQVTVGASPNSGHIYPLAGTYTVVATVTALPTGATAPQTATASRTIIVL